MTTYISVPKQDFELLQTAAELLTQIDAMHATGVSDCIDSHGVPYQSQYARDIIDRIKETYGIGQVEPESANLQTSS